MEHDPKYMQRCIEIASGGLFAAMPNPSVGAVIVYNDTIISEGFTAAFGGAHAEVNAIQSVVYKDLLPFATLYVSLEPCSHFGKTPPCADLIISSGIKNVVVGAKDPNPKVAGNGILKLKNAGISVVSGVLEKECIVSNIRFFTFYEKKRPYIVLKWAETYNNKVAPIENNAHKPFWISNQYSQQLVHKWRSEEQAILVGSKTVLIDNPSLTTRNWSGKNPIRIVLNRKNNIPKSYNVFDNQAETTIIDEKTIDFENNFIPNLVEKLYQLNIQSIIIEGGTQTIQSFIDTNIWDEARVFRSKTFIENGVQAPILNRKFDVRTEILDDELLTFINYD